MTAKEIQKQLAEIIKEIKSKEELLSNQISQYDLQEQDLLHCLEVENCDAVQLVKISSLLKDIRLKRREIKVEFDQIQSITSPWKQHMKGIATRDLDSFAKKTYTYKTNAVYDIAHRHCGDTIQPFHQTLKK